MAENENDTMLYDLRHELKENLHSYLAKYSVNDTQIPPTVMDILERLNCKEICQMTKQTVNILRWKLDRLVRLLDPARLFDNTLSKLKITLTEFQAVQSHIDIIALTLPYCIPGGAGGELEVSEVEFIDWRRERVKRTSDLLRVELCHLFRSHLQFWETVGFSKDSMPDAKMEKTKVAAAHYCVCCQIDTVTRLIQPSLLEAINDDILDEARIISNMLVSYTDPWSPPFGQPTAKAIVPVLKLSRVFLTKISKRTRNDVILFGRIKSKRDLIFLSRATADMHLLVQQLGKSLSRQNGLHPPPQEDMMTAVAKVMTAFNRCSEVLHPSLVSPPPGVDPKLAEAALEWFDMWHCQLHMVLQKMSASVGCDFPTTEYCNTVVNWD